MCWSHRVKPRLHGQQPSPFPARPLPLSPAASAHTFLALWLNQTPWSGSKEAIFFTPLWRCACRSLHLSFLTPFHCPWTANSYSLFKTYLKSCLLCEACHETVNSWPSGSAEYLDLPRCPQIAGHLVGQRDRQICIQLMGIQQVFPAGNKGGRNHVNGYECPGVEGEGG